jgi:hypothetical protein
MRAVYFSGVGLAFGLLVAGASAQEVQWHSAVSLDAPVVSSSSAPPLRQVGGESSEFGSVYRAKNEQQQAQPLPVGPALQGEPAPAPRQMPGVTNAPPVVSEPPQGDVRYSVPMQDGSVNGPFGPIGPGGPMGTMGTVTDCGDCSCGCDCGLGIRSWFHRGDCCDCCCDCCNGCAPRPCFWISGEYLLWTVRNANTPALVTTNGAGALPVIGNQGTTIFSGGTQDFDIRSGGRFTIGFNPAFMGNIGLETTCFFLGSRAQQAVVSSPGVPSIGRPFTNVGPTLTGFPGNQDAELVAFPGVLSGGVIVKTTNSIWGIEENARIPLSCGPTWKVDFIGGFRFLHMDESLEIIENLNVVQPFGGTTPFAVVDRFQTRNDFFGGQAGIDAEWNLWRRWYIGGWFKIGMGDMRQVVNIYGATASPSLPGGFQAGGLLALPGTNIGSYTQNRFAIVPEGGLKLGYNFTDHLRGYLGYDVLYVSSVVRPGDQVNTTVNPTFLPGNGPARGAPAPPFQFRTTDFWAQGFNAGLEWRW